MRHAVRCSLAAALLVLTALPARAEEPYLQFVEGLREKQLFDMALFYLEQIETDPNLPDDIKPLVPYEKAMTLMESARASRNVESQTKQYDQAEAFLEQFTKAYPTHPKAAQANTDRAQILLGKARVEVYQSKSPANTSTKAQYQTKARELVGKARAIFQAAQDLHKSNWEKFPVHIDKDKEPDQYEGRRTAEVNYIRAQLDLALCTYEESQTYDLKSKEYKDLLTKASLEFDAIHTKYRSQVGGLYARMWQGKCFEEQEDIGKALGIYNELLSHPGNSETMHRLQDQVTHFRLICLNHEQRRDYMLVLEEGGKWLAQAKSKVRTPVGLGIRWEHAQASEALGMKRELSKTEQDRYLRQALTDAREINKYPGQYKDVSMFMIQRVNAALGRDQGDPKDFDGALGLGRSMVKQIKDMEDSITGARRANKPKEEIAKLEADLNSHLKENARILKLALTLADDAVETNQLNMARHMLSYVYYRNKQSYEAAILGEFIGARYVEQDPQMALDSAYIALAAWQQAYQVAPNESRDAEVVQMIRVANLIAKNWPESDRANDAKMTLGKLYSDTKRPAEAAEWYGKVPETAPAYAGSQIAAGQSYWTAWLEAAVKPDEERPPQEELNKWQDAAEKHLTTGIEKTSAGIPMDGTPPEEMTAAKVSLAQIKISRGLYKDSLKLLVEEPHPVEKAIAVKDGEPRPPRGVKGKDFYILAYQLVLRSYVGLQDIDKALAAMGKLEALAGGPQSESVMEIYVQLGRELQQEIDRVQNDAKRLAEVQSSFDKFLGELYKRKETMSYNSLIWIGQTYFSIGEGLDSKKDVAAEYFKKASSIYEDILAKAEKGEKEEDKAFAASPKLQGVKLQLSKSKRRQGDFAVAQDNVAEVLKKAPTALEAQYEAASVLQDWGMSGQADSQKKFIEAIEGATDGPLKGISWGWSRIGQRLQRLIDAQKAKPDQIETYFESRYNSAFCRYQFGKSQSSTPKKDEALDSAMVEIDAFTAVAGDMPGDWFPKFDKLYREIQTEKTPGVTPKPLVKPTSLPPVKEKPTIAEEEPEAKPEVAKTPEKPAAAPPEKKESSSTGMIIVLLVTVLAGVGAAGYFVLKPKPKKRAMSMAVGEPPPTFAMPPIGSGPAAKPAAGKPKPAAGPVIAAAGAGAATATVAPPVRKPEGAAAAPRPAAAKPAAAGGAKPAASAAAKPAAAKPATAKPAPTAQASAPKPAAKPTNPKPG